MQEDKLSHEERLRLEALSQAQQLYTMRPGPPPSEEHVLRRAARYERYLRQGQITSG